MGKNACNVKKRVTKKRSAGINKKMTRIKKGKRLMSLKRYVMTSYFLAMTRLRAKMKKQSTRKLSKCLFLNHDISHIW